MTEPVKKTRAELPPDALKQLAARLGTADAAKAIGSSPSHMAKMAQAELVSAPWELASRYVLSRLDKSSFGPTFLLVAISKEKSAVVKTVAESMGGEVIDFSSRFK